MSLHYLVRCLFSCSFHKQYAIYVRSSQAFWGHDRNTENPVILNPPSWWGHSRTAQQFVAKMCIYISIFLLMVLIAHTVFRFHQNQAYTHAQTHTDHLCCVCQNKFLTRPLPNLYFKLKFTFKQDVKIFSTKYKTFIIHNINIHIQFIQYKTL